MPVFGYRARVPLLNGGVDRTEVPIALFAELKNQIGLPSPASAEIESLCGAVLPGRSCAEPQTPGAALRPTTNLNRSGD